MKCSAKKWVVSVAYMGECCNTPHVMVRVIRAKTSKQAIGYVRAGLTRQGFTPSDGVAYLSGSINPKGAAYSRAS
jgi:hypothetical protein